MPHLGLVRQGGFFDHQRIAEEGLLGLRRNQNTLTAADTNKPHTLPPTASQRIDQTEGQGIKSFRRGVDENRGFFQAGADILAQAGEDTSTSFASFGERLGALLPTDPFSDEVRLGIEGNIFGQISREQQQLLRANRGASASRGLSSGGGSGLATAVNLEAGRTRATVSSFLSTEQEQQNTQANQFKAGLEAGLTVSEAQILASLTGGEAGLTAGAASVLDPTFEADFTSDALTAQLGVEQADKLISFMQEAIKDADPSTASQFLEAFSGLLSIQFGDKVGITAQGLAALIG